MLIYIVKLVFFYAWAASCSPPPPPTCRVSLARFRELAEPADRLPEGDSATVLMEAIGLGGSRGPLAGKTKPMMEARFIRRYPGTIRSRPWWRVHLR